MRQVSAKRKRSLDETAGTAKRTKPEPSGRSRSTETPPPPKSKASKPVITTFHRDTLFSAQSCYECEVSQDVQLHKTDGNPVLSDATRIFVRPIFGGILPAVR